MAPCDRPAEQGIHNPWVTEPSRRDSTGIHHVASSWAAPSSPRRSPDSRRDAVAFSGGVENIPGVRDLVYPLRVVGFFEGVSYLLLLGVAMPLKYVAGRPEAVRVLGMAHGVLFIAFVLLVFIVAMQRKWGLRWIAGALVASLLPFGTFVLDRQLARDARPSPAAT